VPLNDLQEELRGLADANVLQNQTGEIETLGILSAVKNSAAINATFEKGEHDGEKLVKALDENIDTRCHQGTQTELCSISITDIVIHGSKTDLESL